MAGIFCCARSHRKLAPSCLAAFSAFSLRSSLPALVCFLMLWFFGHQVLASFYLEQAPPWGGLPPLPKAHIPPLQRDGDRYLMELWIESRQFSPAQLCRINRCRRAKQVYSLADIMTGDGESLRSHASSLNSSSSPTANGSSATISSMARSRRGRLAQTCMHCRRHWTPSYWKVRTRYFPRTDTCSVSQPTPSGTCQLQSNGNG